ncbi:MAG: hypothetical protein HOY79_17730 [Streptomyces sp.]|nr:hypothetical protein [Streptomyces sp.]
MTDEGYTQPPPLMPADLQQFFADVERAKKVVFCAPDMFENVRDAVYGGGLGFYYRVVENRWLKDGMVVLGQSEEEMFNVPLSGSL